MDFMLGFDFSAKFGYLKYVKNYKTLNVIFFLALPKQ